MSEDGLSSDPETASLWRVFQEALEQLGQDISQIGFLDVAVFGRQSSGKSSLLSAICGLQLPIGTGDAMTRCPIRISVTGDPDSFVQLPGSSRDRIPLPHGDSKPRLTDEIYEQALARLSGGTMTDKEMEVKVGRPGHLPLNIVDTPGFIDRNKPDRALVEELIKTVLAGSGQPDRPLLPIMIGTGMDVDINNLRPDLVQGRAFITVFTHMANVITDQPKVEALRNCIQKLANKGCLGCFLVDVPGGKEWPEQKYEEFCHAHSGNDSATYEELLSMCGVPRLLKELRKRQLAHMLSQKQRLVSNLRSLAAQLDVTGYPKTEADVNARLRQILHSIAADLRMVHREGLSSLKSDDQATQVPREYQAKVQADGILRKFTDTSFNDAMKAVMEGWKEEDIKIMANNTLMLNYHTHAWNKTIQGLDLIADKDHAVLACNALLDVLENFIMWRAGVYFQQKHLNMSHFGSFLSEYRKDKSTSLYRDFQLIRDELFFTLPSIQASQIYLFFESQQEQVTKLLGKEGDLVSALLHKSGTWNLPIALKPHNEEFQKELEVAQRRIKLLAFFDVSNMVENLCRRMTYIIFARTYDETAASSWGGAPLTSFPLPAAFFEYFTSINHQEWIDPGQLDTQSKHEAAQRLLTELNKFRATDLVTEPPVYTHTQAQQGRQADGSKRHEPVSDSTPVGESYSTPVKESFSPHPPRQTNVSGPVQDQSFQPATPVQMVQPPAQVHSAQNAPAAHWPDQAQSYQQVYQPQFQQQGPYQQAPVQGGYALGNPRPYAAYPSAQPAHAQAQPVHGVERSSGSSDSQHEHKKGKLFKGLRNLVQ